MKIPQRLREFDWMDVLALLLVIVALYVGYQSMLMRHP
jgi:type VI protein secretion system component VasF